MDNGAFQSPRRDHNDNNEVYTMITINTLSARRSWDSTGKSFITFSGAESREAEFMQIHGLPDAVTRELAGRAEDAGLGVEPTADGNNPILILRDIRVGLEGYAVAQAMDKDKDGKRTVPVVSKKTPGKKIMAYMPIEAEDQIVRFLVPKRQTLGMQNLPPRVAPRSTPAQMANPFDAPAVMD